MSLSRDSILSTRLRQERVDVPELGEAAYLMVRGLTSKERDAFESWAVAEREKHGGTPPNIRAKVVSLTVVDENGERLFRDTDVEALGEQSSVWMDRVFEVGARLSGIGPKDEKALRGNSDPGRDTASSGS